MASTLIKFLVLLLAAGSLISFVLAWRFWLKQPSLHLQLATWRKWLLLSALVAASCDLLLHLSAPYWLNFTHPDDFLKATHTFATVGVSLLVWGLFAALFGQGAVRTLVILYCVLSMLFWFPSAVR